MLVYSVTLNVYVMDNALAVLAIFGIFFVRITLSEGKTNSKDLQSQRKTPFFKKIIIFFFILVYYIAI